jgi:hypothetical protein
VRAPAGLPRWSPAMALPVAMVPIGSQRRGMRWLFRDVPLVLFVAVWQAAVDPGLVDRHFLPSFSETIGALWELARNGEITWNLWVTTYRSLGELVISSLRGIMLVARIIALQTAGGRNGPAAQFDARMGNFPVRSVLASIGGFHGRYRAIPTAAGESEFMANVGSPISTAVIAARSAPARPFTRHRPNGNPARTSGYQSC